MNSLLIGDTLMAASIALFLSVLALGMIKLMPPSDNTVLSALQRDNYYCLLIPLMVPVTTCFIYMNWLGLKLYRHN